MQSQSVRYICSCLLSLFKSSTASSFFPLQAINFLKATDQMPFRMSYILRLSDCVFMMNLCVFPVFLYQKKKNPVFFVNGKLKLASWLDTSKTLLARIIHGENWYFLLHFIYRMSEGFTSKWCYRINFVTVRTFHQKCMFPPLQLTSDLWSDTKHYGTVLFPNISPESVRIPSLRCFIKINKMVIF